MAKQVLELNELTGKLRMKDRTKGVLSAAKIGAWDEAGRRLRNLVNTVDDGSIELAAAALESKNRIQNNIRQQKYEWEPLSPRYARHKRNRGKDPNKILIWDGTYVEAIRVIPMGPRMWAVGIPGNVTNKAGESLAMIGQAHEFGLGNNTPRPHWRPEYEEFSDDAESRLKGLLEDKARGRR